MLFFFSHKRAVSPSPRRTMTVSPKQQWEIMGPRTKDSESSANARRTGTAETGQKPGRGDMQASLLRRGVSFHHYYRLISGSGFVFF